MLRFKFKRISFQETFLTSHVSREFSSFSTTDEKPFIPGRNAIDCINRKVEALCFDRSSPRPGESKNASLVWQHNSFLQQLDAERFLAEKLDHITVISKQKPQGYPLKIPLSPNLFDLTCESVDKRVLNIAGGTDFLTPLFLLVKKQESNFFIPDGCEIVMTDNNNYATKMDSTSPSLFYQQMEFGGLTLNNDTLERFCGFHGQFLLEQRQSIQEFGSKDLLFMFQARLWFGLKLQSAIYYPDTKKQSHNFQLVFKTPEGGTLTLYHLFDNFFDTPYSPSGQFLINLNPDSCVFKACISLFHPNAAEPLSAEARKNFMSRFSRLPVLFDMDLNVTHTTSRFNKEGEPAGWPNCLDRMGVFI